MAALVVLLGERKALLQRLQRVLETSLLRVGFTQRAELVRESQFGSGGVPGLQAFNEQWHRITPFALQMHGGALEKHARSMPECKTLFSRDRDFLLSHGS